MAPPLPAGFSEGVNYDTLQVVDEMDLPPEKVRVYRFFGLLMLIAYAILSTILLGNLLIAIITTRYR